MGNPTKTETSHGQSGGGKATPVPEHKSYGGEKRDEVGGGPAGRGNAGARTVDTGRDWSQGDDDTATENRPVRKSPPEEKNPFSK